jgi:hypothetical protein
VSSVERGVLRQSPTCDFTSSALRLAWKVARAASRPQFFFGLGVLVILARDPAVERDPVTLCGLASMVFWGVSDADVHTLETGVTRPTLFILVAIQIISGAVFLVSGPAWQNPCDQTQISGTIALASPSPFLIHTASDRWPSGRRRAPGKCVGGRPSRGFESLPVRHKISVTRCNAWIFRCSGGLRIHFWIHFGFIDVDHGLSCSHISL